MMRNKPASSMQKTYDDCYLICSTAVYFESQKNEAEALRSWRDALDQIYYHNAYKIPSGWRPGSQTERALQDSLKQMELQCKERVDLLEALRESRADARKASVEDVATQARTSSTNLPLPDRPEPSQSYLGDGTIPPADYMSISRPVAPPALPSRPATRPVTKRPSYVSQKSSTNEVPQTITSPPLGSARLSPNPGQTSSIRSAARTPSPEKRGGMLRTLRSGTGKERQSSGPMARSLRSKPPAAAKAATQAWGTNSRPASGTVEPATMELNGSAMAPQTWDPYTRSLVDRPPSRDAPLLSPRPSDPVRMPSMPSDIPSIQDTQASDRHRLPENALPYPDDTFRGPPPPPHYSEIDRSTLSAIPNPPAPPTHAIPEPTTSTRPAAVRRRSPSSQATKPEVSLPAYRKEYPKPAPSKYTKPPNATPPRQWEHRASSDTAAKTTKGSPSTSRTARTGPSAPVARKAVNVAAATADRQRLDDSPRLNGHSEEETTSSGPDAAPRKRVARKAKAQPSLPSPSETDSDPTDPVDTPASAWKRRVDDIIRHLPKGVDETAAKQIFNEIVIQGDEVHWDDVAGLDIAKTSLKETVVYPFLRPDLFMGLREPARGMLLFGPPGTGKTMLARAVATESRSTFFAISASSLTSKFLGESEKLVRALFALAKVLAPSIIFVDEIDSLLSSRGGGSEHEATRRIKTEFLIQWSDLAKAAAGSDRGGDKGDATRVLVLAATNLPWAIDEAARRRFVRRQYIPLPEEWVRKKQLQTLLSHQKHAVSDVELNMLVVLTDGFSGSDITALAKDAAMGPLRSLGERLLDMSPEDIRPIEFDDFKVSLVNIRPSVGKAGLKEYEDWAKEFGERGG